MGQRRNPSGDDWDDDGVDSGPSDEDQRRFGDEAEETGACPDCGAQIYDNSEVCPKCFNYLGGDTLPRLPSGRHRGLFHTRWVLLVIIVMILCTVSCSLVLLWQLHWQHR